MPAALVTFLIYLIVIVVVDVAGLIRALIYLLIAALVVAVVVYIIARLAAQFVPGAAAFVWILWAIGGLILLLIAFNLFGPLLGV